jgi:hypothetical protein
MRRRVLMVLVLALAVFACVVGVAAASGWHVAKSKSSSGQFTATAIDATINRPHQIGVRFVGGSGLAVWACENGSSVSSYSHNYESGTYVLPHVRGASCDVTASIGGSGKVTVQILTR